MIAKIRLQRNVEKRATWITSFNVWEIFNKNY
jgi:hypothetical protein